MKKRSEELQDQIGFAPYMELLREKANLHVIYTLKAGDVWIEMDGVRIWESTTDGELVPLGLFKSLSKEYKNGFLYHEVLKLKSNFRV